MTEKILIGVAWPFPNGSLHLGQIAGAYLAPDIFARYNRAIGNRVAMVSGTDQNGTPIVVRAEQEGTTPESEPLYGEPVRRVFAPSIHSFHVLDDQRLILYATRSRPYLITLRSKAHGLSFNSVIGLRRQSSSIDASFDEIIVEGFPYAIKRIEKLTPDVAKRLRGIDVPTDEDEETEESGQPGAS